jgi:hypothetical protein
MRVIRTIKQLLLTLTLFSSALNIEYMYMYVQTSQFFLRFGEKCRETIIGCRWLLRTFRRVRGVITL